MPGYGECSTQIKTVKWEKCEQPDLDAEMTTNSRDGEANGRLPDLNCIVDSKHSSSQHKPPEWHIVYGEWAIHTPTGRLRHLACKRFIDAFVRFKSRNCVTMVEQIRGKNHKISVLTTYIDKNLHNRRENLLKNTEPIIHPCQGSDLFEEIEDVIVPAMVVEIAICYMKI